MKKRPVLIINSYAGSLTIAATQEGREIVGSYEDSGYGLSTQRLNFPKLDYRETTADWPKGQDLRGAVVLAHPPCSAFSNMTPKSAAGGGKDWKSHIGKASGAFDCTRRALEHAMKGRADAVCVESVVPAMAGGHQVHEDAARRHGYDVYRVLQNAAQFGVPQWRPRFWAVFVRKGAVKGVFKMGLSVKIKKVGDVLTPGGSKIERDEAAVERQKKILRDVFGQAFARRCFDGSEGPGKLMNIVYKYLKRRGELHKAGAIATKTGRVYEEGSMNAVAKRWCVGGPMFVNVLRFLREDGPAPTVMGSSFWAVRGRALTAEEWKLIMGFPPSYKFPKSAWSSSSSGTRLREYLSKGVCPPVARWVLRQVEANLDGDGQGKGPSPGGVFDFRPRMKDLYPMLGEEDAS